MNRAPSIERSRKTQDVAVDIAKSTEGRVMASNDGSLSFASGPPALLSSPLQKDTHCHDAKALFARTAYEPPSLSYSTRILASHAESGPPTPRTPHGKSEADLLRLLKMPAMTGHDTPRTAQPQEWTATHRMPVTGLIDTVEILRSLVSAGEHKAELPVWQTFVQGVYAGIYIGFGGLLLYSVGAQSYQLKATNPGLQKMMLGLVGLPFALFAIVLTGASLFTSNTMYMPMAWYHGKIGLRAWLINWGLSYFGNLSGCLTIAILAKEAAIFEGVEAAVTVIAMKKVHHLWHQAFIRAILANWCVNLAIWQAAAAHDLWSKFVGIVIPISAFTAMGFEHSIANMFMIPMGILSGAPIPVNHFIKANLIPVTLGNIVAGWLCMATGYTFLFGKFAPYIPHDEKTWGARWKRVWLGPEHKAGAHKHG